MDKLKKAGLGTVFLAFLEAYSSLFGSSSQPDQDISKHFVLDNGLQVILFEKRGVPLIHIAVGVNAGTKNEPQGANGLVHLLEHCLLFRGTEFRSGQEISRKIRENGAYFNASTGQDLAVFDISLPSDRAEFGLSNQKEIVFEFDINQDELDAEKEVILNELALIRDDPRKIAISLAFQHLFAGHPYRAPVYGADEDIRALDVKTIKDFHKDYFVPANCSLAVVGDFSLAEMEERVRRIFGPVPEGTFKPFSFDKAPLLDKEVSLRNEMDVKEAYLVIALVGPDYNSPDQYAVDVLTEMLGRGVNPLIYSGLRARGDLVQTVSMNYMPLKFGGAITAIFTLDPKYVRPAARQLIKFLKNLREMNFSKNDYPGAAEFHYAFDFLQSAKNQILFNSQQGQEFGLRIADSLARHLLLTEKKDEKMTFWENIDRLTSSDLRRAAAKYFSKGDSVVVSVLPKNSN